MSRSAAIARGTRDEGTESAQGCQERESHITSHSTKVNIDPESR